MKDEVDRVFPDLVEEDKQESEVERISREKVTYRSNIHKNVKCDMCGMDPIQGIRFKSVTKEDYDVCIDCEAASKEDDIYLKIKKAGDYDKFVNELATKARK